MSLLPLPDLSRHRKLAIDFETTGLHIWHGAEPVGLAVCGENRQTWYLPWGQIGRAHV